MIIINHRVNNLFELKKVPPKHGIEIDIRYHKDDLILNHDPFNHHINQSTKLKDLLINWKNEGPIILNLKSRVLKMHV